MAWTLHLLVWITVVTSSTAYKYPYLPQQNPAYSIDPENSQDYLPTPDCRVNTRASETVKSSPTRSEEQSGRRDENGSAKILSSFVKPASRRGELSSNQIIFPGPTAAVDRSFEPEIPASCQKSTICEDIPNYPQDEIDKLIAQSGISKQDHIPDIKRFRLDKLDIPETPDITQRLGPTEENYELCNSDKKLIYPQGAKGPDGNWYTLLNNKENPVQGFTVEICSDAEGPCSNIAIFQQGYTGRCVQKYVLRTATVVKKNADGTLTTEERHVKVPSCCSCVAKVNIV